MNVLEDISELLREGIISEETAEKIKGYYKNKGNQFHNKLFIVFGILGAILVGLGILLIIAHNWDNLSRMSKTVLAFLPLLLSQVLCGFSLFKKQESITWKESSSAFLFFGVGASISLISQIYNLSGDLSSFLLLWMLLCLPLVYIMQSSIVSLLYIAGITYYLGEACYWHYPSTESYYYWFLLLAILPYYYKIYVNKTYSNFTLFHHWLVPISVMISLGSVAHHYEELMYIAYFSLFGLFYIIGNNIHLKHKKSTNNGYFMFGSLGTSSLLLSLSSNWFWRNLREEHFQFSSTMNSPEMISCVLILIVASIMLWKQKDKPLLKEFNPLLFVFLIFPIIFIIGLYSPIATVLVNLLILSIGIVNIRRGAKLDHLGILNYGLLMISALVLVRFFDTNLSYVLRGIIFVGVGVGFFVTNFLMLKKRKENGQ